MDNLTTEKLPEDEFFSARLSQAMNLSPLNGKEVSEAAGIDPGYLSNLKKGKRSAPSAPVMKSLSAALGVREEWLASGELPMRSPERVHEAGATYGTARQVPEAGVPPPKLSETRNCPLEAIEEIRAEIIRSIQTGAPPPPRILALIGEVESIIVEVRTKPKP